MQRSTVLALLVFAGLSFATVYQLQRPREAGMQRLDVRAELAAAGGANAANAATKISLSWPADGNRPPVTLERRAAAGAAAGDWYIAENGRAADDGQIQATLARLLSLRSSEHVATLADEKLAAQGPWGLDAAGATTLQLARGGQEILTLRCGAPAATGPEAALRGVAQADRAYLALGARVFAERDGLCAWLSRPAAAWEERHFVAQRAGDLARLEVALAGAPAYALVRDGNGQLSPQWTTALATAAPLPLRFDAGAADQLLARLANLRADALVDADPGPAETGLTTDAADSFRWQAAAAAAAPGDAPSLLLGRAQAGGSVWAKLSTRTLPFLVSAQDAAALRQPLEALQELALLAGVTPEQVAKVRLLPEGARNPRRFEVAQVPATPASAPAAQARFRLLRKDALPAGRRGEPPFQLDDARFAARLAELLAVRALAVVPTTDPRYGALCQAQARSYGGQVVLETHTGGARSLAFGKECTWQEQAAYPVRTEAGGCYVVRKAVRDRLLDNFAALRVGAAPEGQGAGGGLDSLPPEVQKQVLEQLQARMRRP